MRTIELEEDGVSYHLSCNKLTVCYAVNQSEWVCAVRFLSEWQQGCDRKYRIMYLSLRDEWTLSCLALADNRKQQSRGGRE